VPEENDRIATPDIVLTVQLSQGLNNKKTPNVCILILDIFILGNHLVILIVSFNIFYQETRLVRRLFGSWSKLFDKLKRQNNLLSK
jgi:hypothetical protein